MGNPKRRKKSNHNSNNLNISNNSNNSNPLNASNHSNNKEIKKKNDVLSSKISKMKMEDIDSSSSSELSHSSHLMDDDLYTFQAPMDDDLEHKEEDKIFYSILAHSKTNDYILTNEYIKITRRGHPDYTGRVESMFFDKKNKKKKVCLTIFQL